MTLKEKILKDKISAMKAKNSEKKNVLSVLLGEIELIRTRENKELPDGRIVKLVKKMISNNVLTKNESENQFLEGYLPKELTTEEMTNIINEFIQMNKISSMKEMGKVMGYLSKSFTGQYDGAEASKIVKSLLS